MNYMETEDSYLGPSYSDEEEHVPSEKSSVSLVFPGPPHCPSLRSYLSLEFETCPVIDDDECRLVELNNTIKQLSDLIDNPIKCEDSPSIWYLLCKFIHYNGPCNGFYVKHLPQIGEILEFVTLRARRSAEYLDILYELLEVCQRPLLLLRSSEVLNCQRTLQRYFSLLGFLMILVPTRRGFLDLKTAVRRLAADESCRRDALRPDLRREAMVASRLPVTLDELAEVASQETYPDILEIVLELVTASRTFCCRFLETGIVNRILLRMHSSPTPAKECGCVPEIDEVNLELNKEDYYKTLECSTKILWRLMKSRLISDEPPKCLKNPESPSEAAMKSLRASFRREVLRAGRSSRSRKFRNELANLILASLMQRSRGLDATWGVVEYGIADDLADLVVATEFGTARASWAEKAIVEADMLTGLMFKKLLLLSVAFVADLEPGGAEKLKNKRIVSGLLRLVNPSFASVKMSWNLEQLWHLFKYASNAVTFLSPKIEDEFIEDSGSMRLLGLLQRYANVKYEEKHVMCLAEMICALSSTSGSAILRDFRKHEFVPPILQLVERIFNFDALTTTRQEIVMLLLDAIANITESQKPSEEFGSLTKTACDLLRRCLHQRPEDSELRQSFIAAIGIFIWKYLATDRSLLRDFLASGGLYLILDLVAVSELPVQNVYLGLLADVCENEDCNHYLFSWRCGDNGFLALLASVWREEERKFGVERTAEGCIQNAEAPILNDEPWIYLYFTKSLWNRKSIATFTTGAARQKIHSLIERIFRGVEDECRKSLVDRLPLEDRITMLAIDAYPDLKADEATLETEDALEPANRCYSLDQPGRTRKLLERARRVRDEQGKLLGLELAEASRAEREELRRMREARLSPAFDALRELRYVGRTSRRDYLLRMAGRMRGIVGEETRDWKSLCRTFNSAGNFTTIFGQSLKVRSIPKSCGTKDEVALVSPTTSTISPGYSLRSLATTASGSSCVCLPCYEFVRSGNVELKKCSC